MTNYHILTICENILYGGGYMIEKGDIVVRKSYGGDLYFVVTDIDENNIVKLSCIRFRLCADAPLEDVEKVERDKLFEFKKLFKKDIDNKATDILRERKERGIHYISPGKVLHIDSDEDYLNLCLNYYKRLSIPAVGKLIPEASQPLVISELLKEITPDILVLTGHDSIKKSGNFHRIEDYASSSFFVEAVKKARQFRPSKDDLIIFAGACQSDYENIIEAGANFASSPARTMIHALDPVFLVERLSYTFFGTIINAEEGISNTMTGIQGIGGIDTRGTLRRGRP